MKKIDYLKIEELLDLGYSWEAIKEALPGFTDSDRKRYYGFRDGYKMFSERFGLNRMARREQNIRLERKVLGLERSINNEQIRDLALRETLSKQLTEAMKHQEKYVIPTRDGDKFTSTSNVWNTEVVVLGDLHHNGDCETTEQVFSMVLDKLIDKVESEQLDHLYLAEMGDLIEGAGNLRASQAQAVKGGMIEQMVQAMTYYVDFLKKLLDHVNITFITVTSSNHTQLRLMGSKQNELVEEDLMVMFANFVRASIPELEVIAEKQPIVNIRGFNVLFVHGHTVSKNQIDKEISEASSHRNVLIDFMIMGHYHHFETRDVSTSVTDMGFAYDKRVFMIPGLVQETSNFEHDLKASSVPGIAIYSFDKYQGNTKSEKIPIIVSE